MPTALIIGASRGIGHELVRQYLADGWCVIATARKPDDCAQLAAMGAQVHLLDVTSTDACAAMSAKLNAVPLDVAFLNAGVYGPKHDAVPPAADFDAVMHTNVLAAMRLLPLIAPLVCAARGKLAVMSSRMGSISMRNYPSGSLYRASKAALNSVLVDTGLLFGPKGAICVAFHPGWVRTEMGGAGADITVEDSVNGLRRTLAGLTSADNNKFFNYDGTPLGW